MTAAIMTVNQISPIVQLVTNAVSSDHTKRAYERALTEFMQWVNDVQPGAFSKATVQAYVTELRSAGASASSINQRLTSIRKLAIESADNGLITESAAQAICRVEGIRAEGRKLGQWLTKEQASAMIAAPDGETVKGLRDRALLAVLLGCGLRREEIVSLTVGHIQQREGRWVIVDLVGKRNKTRSIPMPSWAKSAIDQWLGAAGIVDGALFRPIWKSGKVQDRPMSAQAIWNTVTEYAGQIGVEVAPHDLRRTFAKLARNGGAELDQIQLSLGHASVETTQRYVGDNQKLHNAPCDALGIQV
ncbi:MAG: tyrosine-type recombinase/integrase [Caldilineaceae bacterium]|nr:tyrosine-type recombinase/integrase [Caldilineaceae bacterium]